MDKKTSGLVLILLVSFLSLTINAGRLKTSGSLIVESRQNICPTTPSVQPKGLGASDSAGLASFGAFPVGDVNHDGTVGMDDIAAVLAAFLARPNDARWNPAADVNQDGTIDMKDVALVARHLGDHADPSTIELHIQGPIPNGGQGMNTSTCLVTPQERIEFFAEVTNESSPQSQIAVSFAIFENNMSLYLETSSVTDENGTAQVNFRMPWPSQNPENLFGVWRATATIQLADQTLTDSASYYYDYALHVWNVTTDRLHYNHGDTVQMTINYGSISDQTTPVLFEASIVDELGVTVANAASSTQVGGAACGTYTNWTQSTTLYLPKWASAGSATIHVNVFGLPPQEGMPILQEHVGPTIIIDPH